MKRLFTLAIMAVIGMLIFNTPVVYASTLDEIVSENQEYEIEAGTEAGASEIEIINNQENEIQQIENQITSIPVGLNYIQSADDLGELSPVASKINTQINRAASLVVQILAYFITAFLAVRVLVDLSYIIFPFTRNLLAPGAMSGMQGGMGMNMQGNMGMGNQIGGNMGHQGRMGMGQPMGIQMQGAVQSNRKVLVTNAAINAASLETTQNALKLYAKDMIIVLIVTPILLVLAVTGTLTDLGFMIGELISKGINNLGNMI